MGRDVEEWFIREILPLEPMLERFLKRNLRNREDVADVRQDAYVRVFEKALIARPLHPKQFLFQVARNLLIDRARRNRVVSFENGADFDRIDVSAGLPDAEDRIGALQEFNLLRNAITGLPPRCREVVTLRKFEGLSQREVAAKMGIAEDTVERQMSNGVRLLREHLAPAPRSRHTLPLGLARISA